MKLRFENNSIRYRVRKSELAQLKQQGFIQEVVNFPGQVFIYELSINNHDQLLSEIKDSKISVAVPQQLAQQWMDTEEVGIYQSLPTASGTMLEIIIEKDFPCKDRPDEDKTDTFTELAAKDEKGKVC